MNDERFEQAAAGILRASAIDVDAATQARLLQARRAALAAWPQRRFPVRSHAPALAVAAAALFAVVVWLGVAPGRMGGLPEPLPARAAVAPDVSTSDVEFLMTDTSMEMIRNLEFFSWLDADRSDAELRAEMEAVGPPGA